MCSTFGCIMLLSMAIIAHLKLHITFQSVNIYRIVPEREYHIQYYV